MNYRPGKRGAVLVPSLEKLLCLLPVAAAWRQSKRSIPPPTTLLPSQLTFEACASTASTEGALLVPGCACRRCAGIAACMLRTCLQMRAHYLCKWKPLLAWICLGKKAKTLTCGFALCAALEVPLKGAGFKSGVSSGCSRGVCRQRSAGFGENMMNKLV